MSFDRRSFLAATLASAAALTSRGAFADNAYPTKPVRLVVPYAAGGGTDFFARLAGTSP